MRHARPNHRRFERVTFGRAVRLWQSRQAVAVEAANISEGGLFLRTDRAIPPGAYLTVQLSLPGHTAFSAICKVTRTVSSTGDGLQPGLGLSFIDMRLAKRRALAAFVQERFARSHAA